MEIRSGESWGADWVGYLVFNYLTSRLIMFYIEEDDEVALPKKYHVINNICAIFYDQLAEIIGNSLYEPLTVTHFKNDEWNKSLKEELETNDIHILDLLKGKGRHREISTV